MLSRRGFTLIELVVVIVVLAIMLALVLPSLQSGKESGVTLLCTSNLKQINIITSIYCQDNLFFPQGFCALPDCIHNSPEGGHPGNHVYDWVGWWWFNYLDINYTAKDEILWCPARRRMLPPIGENILCSNYGANYAITKWAAVRPSDEFRGPPLRKTAIRQPSHTVLYMDSGYALINWQAVVDGFVNPFEKNPSREDSFFLPGLDMNKTRTIRPEQDEDAIQGRHPRQNVNIGFVDGHVAKEKAERLSARQDEEGNIISDYIWSPGE